MNSLQTLSSAHDSVEDFDSRPRRISRRAQFEQRLNRQWRQQRRTLAIIGGTLAFLGGLMWPSTSPEKPSARLAANASSSSLSR